MISGSKELTRDLYLAYSVRAQLGFHILRGTIWMIMRFRCSGQPVLVPVPVKGYLIR